ncbi:hypothetical protein LPJ61_005013, partial [Coemansia biformis]
SKKRQARPQARTMARAKTPWTTEENVNLFRVMAEYTYVDKTGIRPLVIYLNPSELDHVEQCEMSLNMSDAEIAQSLCEQEVENNPNRCGHLLFGAMRHMQRASGDHSIRVVNEKVKNVRSRIVNWFVTMYTEGALPTKRPVRYVTAILNSLVTAPFCPVKDVTATMAMGLYATSETKHDVSLWLQAMFWLHPRRMYDFLYQCALQVVRARIETMPMETRSHEDTHMMNTEYPDTYVLIEQLRRLISVLNNDSPSKAGKRPSKSLGHTDSFDPYDMDDSATGRKRKRKLIPQESVKRPRGSDAMIPTNGDEQIPLSMFDLLKNEEKLRVAGLRVKMIAAVGGIIRSAHANTSVDIKYHLYRLWTCVARFSEVSRMLVPTHQIPQDEAAAWPRFAEFVIVHDYSSPFDIAAIEPRIRVSKTRMAYQSGFNAADLIEQWISSTEGELRPEVPMWLTVARRIDGEHVLALVISSLDTEIPAGSSGLPSMHPSLLRYRKFSDDEIHTTVDTAIANGGNNLIGELAMCSHGGLDPWPWSSTQHTTVSMTHGYNTQIRADVAGSSIQLVLSSAYATSPNVIDPWMEPRVMATAAFNHQKSYADANTVGESSTFDELIKEEQKSVTSDVMVEPPVVSKCSSSNHQAAWQPMPAMPLEGGSLSAINSLATLTAPDLSANIHDASKLASAALMSSYATSTNGYNSS